MNFLKGTGNEVCVDPRAVCRSAGAVSAQNGAPLQQSDLNVKLRIPGIASLYVDTSAESNT